MQITLTTLKAKLMLKNIKGTAVIFTELQYTRSKGDEWL